jgi:hypothetical protein
MTVEFELDGQRFVGINGGLEFTFDEAVSFEISCETQDEVDYYWERLSEGGQEGPCGWLKDRYGPSWQVVPTGMEELFVDPDPTRPSARCRPCSTWASSTSPRCAARPTAPRRPDRPATRPTAAAPPIDPSPTGADCDRVRWCCHEG